MKIIKPKKFEAFVAKHGSIELYEKGRIFHSQDFPDKLFLLKKGYVKRYQTKNIKHRVLELIYGPDHLISLSQLYKRLFGIDQNQDAFLYVYQAMTDVEMQSIDADAVIKELARDPAMYQDFFYESGLKLRSNILRLASNSMKADSQKVAHQLVGLAYEFGGVTAGYTGNSVALPLPQTATDLAEQLNIKVAAAQKALDSFSKKKLIKLHNDKITILNIELLTDMYL